jgi:DNA-binding CsgD family transcriptional regulator
MIALATGDLAGARDSISEGLAGIFPWMPRYCWPMLWAGMRVEADEATRFRDRREAVPARIAQRCEQIAGVAATMHTSSPPQAGYQALVTAEHARATGADDAGLWAAAVTAWRRAAEPHPLSYSLLRLAEVHSSGGDRDAAADAVQQAHALAERIGAAPIAAEAAALARRTRLPLAPGPADPAGVPGDGKPRGHSVGHSAGHPVEPVDELARFGLTDREREVLLLVAAGHSNPEIAKALFISAKTASVHVSNILAKLGVGGRVEAAAVVHRLGVTPTMND